LGEDLSDKRSLGEEKESPMAMTEPRILSRQVEVYGDPYQVEGRSLSANKIIMFVASSRQRH
jgi:hypothetical protein